MLVTRHFSRSTMVVHEQFEIVIPSEIERGQEVQERIVSCIESRDFPPRDVFGVRLALEEALVNAIKHGNGLDPEKTVRISCRLIDDLLRVEIEDQGPGFCIEDVPDPTAEENLDRPCGRGIMLIRSFMTKVEYNPTGNLVVLEKERTRE